MNAPFYQQVTNKTLVVSYINTSGFSFQNLLTAMNKLRWSLQTDKGRHRTLQLLYHGGSKEQKIHVKLLYIDSI